MKRIAMVVYSFYPNDPRVFRQAEALTKKGYEIDIICMRGFKATARETINGVRVIRVNQNRNRSSKFRYFSGYAMFLLRAFWHVSLNHMRKRYDAVHIHNMPDILVLTALLPKLTGAKIVLDLHDPMPEVFLAKFGTGYGHPLIKLMIAMEKFSIRFANLVLTPNLAFRDLFIQRGCPESKIHIIMNSPIEEIFDEKLNALTASEESRSDESAFVLMYHGSVVERHGLDDAVKAIAKVKDQIPQIHFNVFGGGEFVPRFEQVIVEEGVEDYVTYFGGVNIERIAREIARVDLGIIPNKRSPFTEINLPTRIFEYLSMKKPVVACKTKGIMDYFSDKEIFYFEPGNIEDLAAAILRVYEDREKSRQVMQRGHEVYSNFRWDFQKEYLADLYHALFSGKLDDIKPQLPEHGSKDITDVSITNKIS